MTLIRFNSDFAPLRFSNRMLRFSDLMNDFYGRDFTTFQQPLTNVVEKSDGYQIEISVPGYQKEEISIRVEDGILEISGSRKAEDNKDVSFLRRDFAPSSFTKRYELPENVNSEQISAAYENGILRVIVPLKESTPKPSPVSINIS